MFISLKLISDASPVISILSCNVVSAKISTTVISEKSISAVLPASKINNKSLITSFVSLFISENDAPVFSVTPDILPHNTISKIPVSFTTISVPFGIDTYLLLPGITLVLPICAIPLF